MEQDTMADIPELIKEENSGWETCPKCGTTSLEIIERPDTPHFAELKCMYCGHIKWIKNPINKGIRTITSKYSVQQILGFYKKGGEFCFFCLRTKEQLGLHETLTKDHIEEIDKGGKDELSNLQILCTACHKLKNWARLYMNWHNKDGEK